MAPVVIPQDKSGEEAPLKRGRGCYLCEWTGWKKRTFGSFAGGGERRRPCPKCSVTVTQESDGGGTTPSNFTKSSSTAR